MTIRTTVDDSSDDDEAEEPRQFASPPCYLHEIDPAYHGTGSAPVLDTSGDAMDKADWKSISAWRRQQRSRLLSYRKGLGGIERSRVSATIIDFLRKGFGFDAACVGFYWALEGEIDLRPLIHELLLGGIDAALPVVIGKDEPLEFWRWKTEIELRIDGVWGIPIPVERNVVRPSVLLVPLLGFDDQGNRLGHGGGYYDRTLATLEPSPLTIGIGYEFGRLPTIYPQDHDVPMDATVTERGISWHSVR